MTYVYPRPAYMYIVPYSCQVHIFPQLSALKVSPHAFSQYYDGDKLAQLIQQHLRPFCHHPYPASNQSRSQDKS
jgi:hypothetical protein